VRIEVEEIITDGRGGWGRQVKEDNMKETMKIGKLCIIGKLLKNKAFRAKPLKRTRHLCNWGPK